MRNFRMDSSRRGGVGKRRDGGGWTGRRGREQLLGSDRIIHVIIPCGELELGQSIFKRISYSPLKGRDTNNNLKMGTSDL